MKDILHCDKYLSRRPFLQAREMHALKGLNTWERANAHPHVAAGARARARCGPRACKSVPGPIIMIPLPPPAESEMRPPPGNITSCVRTLAISWSVRGGGSGLTTNTGPSASDRTPPPPPRRVGRWGTGGRGSSSLSSGSPPSSQPSSLSPPAWAAAPGTMIRGVVIF